VSWSIDGPQWQEVAGDQVLRGEVDAAAGAVVVAGDAGAGPFQGGPAGQVRGPSGGEVAEEQRGRRIDVEVAEGVEHVVALVVGPPQAPVLDADESRRAAAVRGVVAASGVGGADQEGVGPADQVDVVRREDGTAPHQ
jgi:hypothetical protein